MKMPQEGHCVFDDHIRGRIEVAWTEEQDHVIQRTDGTVLYNLANVVDDHDMQITHVIRAAEHLSNTPRQIFIAQGLDYPLPEYAHVPFVAEPGTKTKLSKRRIGAYLKHHAFKKLYEHGESIAHALGLTIVAETFNPVMVDFYAQVGYVPVALLNYLVLLGWSLDDRTEFFSRDEMIQCFSLERIHKAPASFDPQKLFAFQEHYMHLEPLERKVALNLPYLQRAGLLPPVPTAAQRQTVHQVVQAAGERLKVAGDIVEYAYCFFADEHVRYDEAAFAQRLRTPPEAAGILRRAQASLQRVEPFTAATLEQWLQDFIQAEGIRHGQIVHALRIAVTGKTTGFGLFDSLAIFGKPQCLARIERALARL